MKEKLTIPYKVGNVVYSVDKDRLYLLGKDVVSPR